MTMIKNSIYKIPLKEKICVLLEKNLDKLLLIPAFQRYVNRKANNKYGSTFITHEGNSEIDDVFKDYHFNDIQKTDIVMDIGAHVGGFSLFVSRFVSHVYAIEPMLYEKLEQNVKINNIKNITILPCALGLGIKTIKWTGCKDKGMICHSLSEIIKQCNSKMDFLKCDCEGGELSIRPEELQGIRRIEAEVHNFDGTHNLQDFLEMLDKAKFEYTYTSPREGILIVHARNKTL